jgi:hypothetical protein
MMLVEPDSKEIEKVTPEDIYRNRCGTEPGSERNVTQLAMTEYDRQDPRLEWRSACKLEHERLAGEEIQIDILRQLSLEQRKLSAGIKFRVERDGSRAGRGIS